jgi:carbon storage regulator CsrA
MSMNSSENGYLVLERCTGEEILIGDDISIEVVRIYQGSRGNPKVKLGILAPRSVKILRAEISDRKSPPPAV